MLEIQQLGCERDERALFENLKFQLSKGDLLQIEGANGTGKTTLLRILAGLSADYSGQILWKNQPLSKQYADFRLSTFYFGHKPAVKAELTPTENILWRASLRNETYTQEQIIQALSQVNLSGYEETPCGQLSAGQHRRVALADLSICRAKLWILDEPFTAIDVYGVAWLEQLLKTHVNQGGMVIITSHQSLSEVSGTVRKVKLEEFQGSPADVDEEGLMDNDEAGVFL